MTAAIDSHPVISRITLALLEDSGWYIPDYQQLKMLSWSTDFEVGLTKCANLHGSG